MIHTLLNIVLNHKLRIHTNLFFCRNGFFTGHTHIFNPVQPVIRQPVMIIMRTDQIIIIIRPIYRIQIQLIHLAFFSQNFLHCIIDLCILKPNLLMQIHCFQHNLYIFTDPTDTPDISGQRHNHMRKSASSSLTRQI